MVPPPPASLGLHRYGIKSKHDDTEIVITAKTPDQAWIKFVAQRFGALKPDRKDWTITAKKD